MEAAVPEDHAGDLHVPDLPPQQPVHIHVEPRVLPAAAMLLDLHRGQHLVHQPVEFVQHAVGNELQHDLPLFEARKAHPHRNGPQQRQRRGDVNLDLLAVRLQTGHRLRQRRIRRQDADQLFA